MLPSGAFHLKDLLLADAEKISVGLTPEMLRLIEAAVEAGEFASVSEALRDAVRAWQREQRAERLEAIRARIRRSLEDPSPGLTVQELQAEMEEYLDQLERDFKHSAE